jgi:mono/diheme cytochrome c family protein
MAKTAYDTDLDRNPASYQPLTPLGFLERVAAVFPNHTAIIHGPLRRSYLEFYARSRRLASALAKRGIGRALILVCLLLAPGLAQADEPTITITVGNDKRSFTRDELLKRPDATTIDVARDVSYRMQMSYRAVPVASLLAGMKLPDDSVIEAVALDGFIAQLPPDLVLNTDNSKAVAWLAIEPVDRPWPQMPGKDTSAGPFYIVWTGAEVGGIRSEQWPYHIAQLVSQPSPASRWPALAVNSALPSTDPARAGQVLFVVQCLPCHRLNGAGASDVGPDLNVPQNPTEYLTPQGLHDLIRDPRAVRAWPAMTMPAFPPDHLSEREIGLLIAYLKHMAARKH